MNGGNIENCWEYWKCSDETKMVCPVYERRAGSICWTCVGAGRPFINRGFKHCGQCPWFKKKSPEVYGNNRESR